MKWYLASYPSHCYLPLSRTKFQQFFLYASCRGYFKNTSGKYESISGEKCVISLHEDSAETELGIKWEEFNISVCPLWQCWFGWTDKCLGSKSPGTCHGHRQGHPACTMPVSFLFCYSTTMREGFHMFIRYWAWCSAHSSPRIQRALFIILAAKEKVVWD